MKDRSQFIAGSSESQKLVVLLHAYTGNTARLSGLVKCLRGQVDDQVEVLAEKFGDADILIPAMPASLFSFSSVETIVRQVATEIDAADKKKSGYGEIVLVGHSLGGAGGSERLCFGLWRSKSWAPATRRSGCRSATTRAMGKECNTDRPPSRNEPWMAPQPPSINSNRIDLVTRRRSHPVFSIIWASTSHRRNPKRCAIHHQLASSMAVDATMGDQG